MPNKNDNSTNNDNYYEITLKKNKVDSVAPFLRNVKLIPQDIF